MSENNFIVTARKYRPQTFSDVVGQEHISTTIKNAIVNKRIAHAYLFTGPRGCGKTTTARILAKTLNCLEPKDGEPCNKCEMCKSFLESQSLDIIEIDGASNRRIEEIRTLRESVKYAPTKGKYKVYIIDEVHMLTTESFNALLKTLEEPPGHTIFIFATTDIHKVPLTIISRCQRFDFRRIEISAMKNHLKIIAIAEKIEIDDLALSLIAKKADGALRDAQSLFDQVISYSGNKVDSTELTSMFNLIDEEIYFQLSEAIVEKKLSAAFEITKVVYENGWNFIDFLNGLTEHFRNILTAVIRKDVSFIEDAEIYQAKYLTLSAKFSESDLLRILSFINKATYELKSSSNQKLKIEVSLAQLIGLAQSSTISALINKLDKTDVKLSTSSIVKEPISNISSKKTSSISNIAEVTKADVILPKVESFVIPEIANEKDIPNVIAQWESFVNQVKNEKVFFGSVLVNSNPINILNDQIHLEVGHPEDEDIIKSNESYLDSKTKEVFGKKLKINISKKRTTPNKTSSDELKLNSEENSQIAESIIHNLGGKEISKF